MSWPYALSEWRDSEGRRLVVTAVAPDDTLGRQIRGRVWGADGVVRDYATDAPTFDEVWRKRLPPTGGGKWA